jgi:iron complex transport system substrate-binding protein
LRWRAISTCAAALLAILAGALPAPAGVPQRKPQRVVSLNLCSDELLLQLADRDTVASVSFLATDPSLSSVADLAAGLPANRGRLEEIVALHPDLVLAHRYAGRSTTEALRRLGYRVVEIDSPQDLDAVRQQILDVADALDVPQRGRAMVASFDARLAALPPVVEPRPTAAIYQPNGYAFGRDSLADRILALAGFANLAAQDGVRGYARLSLEQLVAHPPDRLVLEGDDFDRRSMAQQFLSHPALRDRFPPQARIVVPRRLWLCAGLNVATAAELLARARLAQQAKP